jgi:LPXTG-motif cell wall-anchored protein
MAQDENGERHVTVNGVDIIESDTGILPNDVIEKAEARVYNYKKAALPETEEQEILPPTTSTPSKPAGSTSSGIIPQLGNNSSTWLILLGLAVMLGSVLIWRKRRAAGN